MSNKQYQLELSKEKVPQFKFIVVGDQSVGKSCLVRRYQDGDFIWSSKPTIGVEFIKKLVEIDKQLVEIQIWDTAGQEQFRSMVRNFYRGSAAVFVVYSVNQRESFDQLPLWLNDIESNAHEDIVKILVGNKCDLSREIEKQEAEIFMNKCKFSLFFETSAKTGDNVEEAFVDAVKLVLLKYISSESFRMATKINKRVTSPIKIIKNSESIISKPQTNGQNSVMHLQKESNEESKCC